MPGAEKAGAAGGGAEAAAGGGEGNGRAVPDAEPAGGGAGGGGGLAGVAASPAKGEAAPAAWAIDDEDIAPKKPKTRREVRLRWLDPSGVPILPARRSMTKRAPLLFSALTRRQLIR